ncbi:MAG: hypothetical protein ACFB22_06820 [Rhodothalassiaceae bacterium]
MQQSQDDPAPAEGLRAWVVDLAPTWADPFVARLPGLLLIPALAAGLVGALWVGITTVRTVGQGAQWLGTLISDPGAALRSAVTPPNTADITKQALREVLEEERARRTSDALTPEEQAASDAAVDRLAERPNEQAKRARRLLAKGDVAAAFSVLTEEAEQADQEAAARWKELGALAKGIDTARALEAYEQAFQRTPKDFCVCIELSRLRQEAGKTAGALAAAHAADQAAQSEREMSVAWINLGDVLEQAGDLAGARARYEAGLEIATRLAAANPGSAAAQRDLIVSFAKLGAIAPGAGWWAKGLAVAERLAADGRLAPADQWMLAELREKAAAEAASMQD